MKVIKRAEATFSKQFDCHNCGSTLEADETDVKRGDFSCGWGGDRPELRYYLECPVCQSHIKLNNSELSVMLRDMVNKEYQDSRSRGRKV